MSPAEIRRALAAVEASIARHRAELAADERQAMLLRQMLEVEPGLHSVEHRSTVKGEVDQLTDTHRLNISASRGGSDPFLRNIRAAGYTLRSLAKECGVSASMLSMNRRTHGVPKARAEKIQALTGWPADRRHWPAGILS